MAYAMPFSPRARSAQPAIPMFMIALHRGTEVIVVAVIGWVAEVVVDAPAGGTDSLHSGNAANRSHPRSAQPVALQAKEPRQ
jgi:hypothetical protein